MSKSGTLWLPLWKRLKSSNSFIEASWSFHKVVGSLLACVVAILSTCVQVFNIQGCQPVTDSHACLILIKLWFLFLRTPVHVDCVAWCSAQGSLIRKTCPGSVELTESAGLWSSQQKGGALVALSGGETDRSDRGKQWRWGWMTATKKRPDGRRESQEQPGGVWSRKLARQQRRLYSRDTAIGHHNGSHAESGLLYSED